MKKGLDELGYQTGEVGGAVVPVIIGHTAMTFMIWKELVNGGVYTNPVLFPAVKKGQEMLRTSYLATQTEEHLSRALEVFHQVGKNYDICK